MRTGAYVLTHGKPDHYGGMETREAKVRLSSFCGEVLLLLAAWYLKPPVWLLPLLVVLFGFGFVWPGGALGLWGHMRAVRLKNPFYLKGTAGTAADVEPDSGIDTSIKQEGTKPNREPTDVQREAVETLRILYGSASEAAEVAEAILYRLSRKAIQGDRPHYYLGLLVMKCILEVEQATRTKLANNLDQINKTENENLFGLFYLDYVKVRAWIKQLGELPQDQRDWEYNHSDQYADWWNKDLRFHDRFQQTTYRSDMETLRRFYRDNGWGPDLPPPQSRIATT